MRQLMFVKVGRLEWREVPEPTLQSPLDALVRPIAVARCDLDPVFMTTAAGAAMRVGLASHWVDPIGQLITGTPPYAPPFAVGHECVAEVLAVAADVKQVQVGQRVVLPFQIACGHCGHCANGVTSRCSSGPLPITTYGFGPGARIHGGMLTDVVRVPYADAMLVPLPEGVDPVAAASASDNLPDAFRSVAPGLRERPGGSVLVVGGAAQSIGLYAVAIAKALGAGAVDYYDSDRERLTIAERLGARVLPAARRWGRNMVDLPRRYTLSVDACSDMRARGLELALRSLEPAGLCTSVGIYPMRRTPVPLLQMYVDGITLRTGISNARSTIPDVLALMAQGRLDPRPVTTRVANWQDASDAFLERTTKVVVTR